MFQIKWLWKNMKGFRGRYILAMFTTVIISISIVGNSLIVKHIMDTVFSPVQEGSPVTEVLIRQLVMLVALMIGYRIVQSAVEYISIMTYESCSQKLIYKLRNELYTNMQRQDATFYSKNRTGDLMTRLTGDMDMIRHSVAWVFRMLIDCVVLFTATTVCFFLQDPLLAGCLLIVTPFIFAITAMFGKRVGPAYVDLREKLSSLNIAAQENIAGNRVVKAFTKEGYEISKFNEKNDDFKEANLHANLLWLKYAPYIDGLSQSLSVAVLLVGGIFLISGRISIGTFTLFNGLVWALTNPMRTIGMVMNDLQRFFASSAKIVELYYSRSTITNRHNAHTSKSRLNGEIVFDNVSLKLGDTVVLKDISFSVKKGETVAIMGSTGSGKTSLVGIVPRFFDVASGKATVDGIPINEWDIKTLRSAIGIATQEVFLFSDTVDGNIAYGDSKMPVEEVARFAKAANVDFISKLSSGFDTVIGERGVGLSGGQKQRIALARALAVKPSILILDDTTSAVDLETEKEIQNALENLDFSCTKLIVAQRISTTKRADKIIILDKGRVIQMGTHDELSKIDGYYREVFLLQNGEESVVSTGVKGGAHVG